jgi:putative hemolysin
MGSTISFEMTWQTAVEILIAALEDGTGEGKKAARKEVRRMAEILDHLKNRDAATPAIGRWDVICNNPTGIAFGVTFGDEDQAGTYADRMAAAGYEVDRLPAFEAETSAEGALIAAAEVFADPSLISSDQ